MATPPFGFPSSGLGSPWIGPKAVKRTVTVGVFTMPEGSVWLDSRLRGRGGEAQVLVDVPAVAGDDDLARRVGRFRIPDYVVNDYPADAIAVLAGVLVVRSNRVESASATEYVGYYGGFDIMENESDVVPYYDVDIESGLRAFIRTAPGLDPRYIDDLARQRMRETAKIMEQMNELQRNMDQYVLRSNGVLTAASPAVAVQRGLTSKLPR